MVIKTSIKNDQPNPFSLQSLQVTIREPSLGPPPGARRVTCDGFDYWLLRPDDFLDRWKYAAGDEEVGLASGTTMAADCLKAMVRSCVSVRH